MVGSVATLTKIADVLNKNNDQLALSLVVLYMNWKLQRDIKE